MVCFSFCFGRLTGRVKLAERHLLSLHQPQVEIHIHLGNGLGKPAALIQPDEFDHVSALMATVAVPAGLVHLQTAGLFPVERAADVSSPVGLVPVVLDDLPGRDALLDDRSSFHDGHVRLFTTS